MGSNIREFSRRMQKRRQEIGVSIRERRNEVAMHALETAVEISPVRDGDFRGAWRLSDSRQMTAPNTPDPDGSATIDRGRADLEALSGDGPIYLVNAMPYAGKIENGSSEQAPQGVLGITEQRTREYVGRSK